MNKGMSLLVAVITMLILSHTATAQRQSQKTKQRSEDLVKRAPEGVTVVPDLAYREGHEKWKLDLAMPTERGNSPRPAIVFVHGGGWRGGDRRQETFISPALEFASKGYVCITVSYRFLTEVPLMDCIADVKCSVRWLRANAEKYNVDPNRIGAYGNSAGAHLVAMLGLCPKSAGMEGDGPWQEHSSMVQAVCCSATPTSFLIAMSDRQLPPNLSQQDANRQQSTKQNEQQADRVKPKQADTNQQPSALRSNSPYLLSEELKKKISPVSYACAEAPPFLLVHEASDKTVGIHQTETFVEALRKAGAKDVTFLRYEDGTGHGTFMANIQETGPAREAFFARTLMQPSK